VRRLGIVDAGVEWMGGGVDLVPQFGRVGAPFLGALRSRL
jgi:coproporphyrinogen III oxidase